MCGKIVEAFGEKSKHIGSKGSIDFLRSKAAESIKEAIVKQLSIVNVFNETENNEENITLLLTNLGCVGVFSD